MEKEETFEGAVDAPLCTLAGSVVCHLVRISVVVPLGCVHF